MTCSQCGKFFCWSCGKLIDGYDHFEGRPECWGILEAQIADELYDDDLTVNGSKFTQALKKIVSDIADDYCMCPKC